MSFANAAPMKVGFIGLGDQGGGMARAVARAGHDLHVWARRPSVAEAFAAQGAHAAPSAAALAEQVEMLCLCVRSDEDVRSVCFSQGVISSMRPSAILAIHATVAPGVCVDIAEAGSRRGVVVLDAPVSGGAAAAEAGRLLVMVGGDLAAAERATPVLRAFADTIVRTGGVGTAQLAKTLNNLLFTANLGLALDALRLGSALGLDPEPLERALTRGSGRSGALEAVTQGGLRARARHLGAVLDKDLRLAERAFADGSAEGLLRLARSALAELDPPA